MQRRVLKGMVWILNQSCKFELLGKLIDKLIKFINKNTKSM